MLTDWALTGFFFLGSQTVGAMIRTVPSFSNEQNSILETRVSLLAPKVFFLIQLNNPVKLIKYI